MLGKAYYPSRKCVLAIDESVRIVDPAVDPASDLAAYRDSLYDVAKLKLVDGVQPTWWTLRPLTRRQKDTAEAYQSPRAKAAYHIRCGLMAVEGYCVEGGQEVPPIVRGADGLIPEDWLDAVDFPEEVLVGLWVMIRTLSEGSAPFSRRSVRPAGPST